MPDQRALLDRNGVGICTSGRRGRTRLFKMGRTFVLSGYPAPAPAGERDVAVCLRGSPFTTAGFARMVERAAAAAGLELKAHPHMLRHACGYALANKGHDTRAIQGWLGHRSITSTAVYTALAPV
jgi:site-specific recombinase XerD